ncbi:unnamed protein product [Ectocarpus sp. 12 AP-2014]
MVGSTIGGRRMHKITSMIFPFSPPALFARAMASTTTSSTKQYSVRATYLAPVRLSPALLRRLRSWWLVAVGRRARWDQKMLPLTSIFRMLENGCRARIRTSDESESKMIFLRAGLHHVVLDCPEQAGWSNVKHPSADIGCPRCKISKHELANPNYDFRASKRTAEEGLDASIEYASKGGTEPERNLREKRQGVVIPKEPNPLKALTFDRLLQSPFDILHQDALASIRNLDHTHYHVLDPAGLELVAARLALRQLLPPNASPIGEVTTDGGWSGITANQIWTLSSTLGLLFAPIFADGRTMGKYIRSAEIRAVREQLDANEGTTHGARKLYQGFRDLIQATSASTFMGRMGSYTDETLDDLEKRQRESMG